MQNGYIYISNVVMQSVTENTIYVVLTRSRQHINNFDVLKIRIIYLSIPSCMLKYVSNLNMCA